MILVRIISILSAVLFLAGCQAELDLQRFSNPVIQNFQASQNVVEAGSAVELWAEYDGGSGVIDNNVGAIASRSTVSFIPADTARYTLVVTNSDGGTARQFVNVEVVSPPGSAITTPQAVIPRGDDATLVLEVSNGSGYLASNPEQRYGEGVHEITVTPTTDTTYELVVESRAGTTARDTVSIELATDPVITALSSDVSVVSEGNEVAVTAVFKNGVGHLSGYGIIESGQEVRLVPERDTPIQLLVENGLGATTQQSITVDVIDAPTIGIFESTPSEVLEGDPVDIVAVFDGGSGFVSGGVGPVSSGVVIEDFVPAPGVAYELTVINDAEDRVQRELPLNVVRRAQLNNVDVGAIEGGTYGDDDIDRFVVTAGGEYTVTAEFAFGSAELDGMALTSGETVTVAPTVSGVSRLVVESERLGHTAEYVFYVDVIDPPETIDFRSSDGSVDVAKGDSIIVEADYVNGVGRIMAGDENLGPIASGGSRTLTLDETVELVLVVENEVGSIDELALPVTVYPLPEITRFELDEASIPNGGETRINVEFVGGPGTTATITPPVRLNGDGVLVNDVPSGFRGPVRPDATTSYVLEVTDPANQRVTRSIDLEVLPSVEIESFTVTRNTITVGDSVKLTGAWQNAGAEDGDVVISPGSLVPTSGHEIEVAPESTTTYTLTVQNPISSASESVLVEVFGEPAISGLMTPDFAAVGEYFEVVADFENGRADVVNGTTVVPGGADLVSGVARQVKSPDDGSPLRVRVENGAGKVVYRDIDTEFQIAPTINNFKAVKTKITEGEEVQLSYDFIDGDGLITVPGGATIGVSSGTGSVLAGVKPTVDTTYTLTVQNDIGQVREASVLVEVYAVPEVLSLTGTPGIVTNGSKAVLTAEFPEGMTARFQGIDDALISGVGIEVEPPPGTTTTYDLVVENGAGATATASVSIQSVEAPIADRIDASADVITVGDSVTLTPQFSRGTGEINDSAVTANQGFSYSPTETTTYRLTVTNAAGDTATAIRTIEVVDAPQVVSFDASDNPVTKGDTVSFTPVYSGASGDNPASITGVADAITSGGSYDVIVNSSAPYTLEVRNAAGASVSDTVTITAYNPAVIDTFSVSAQPVTFGQPFSLTWDYSTMGSADGSAYISGPGMNRAVSQSDTVQIDDLEVGTYDYELTVTNLAGDEVSQTVSVEVVPQAVIGSFTVSPGAVLVGEDFTVSWTVANAVSVTLNGDPVDVDSGSKVMFSDTYGTEPLELVATNAAGDSETENLSVVVDDILIDQFEAPALVAAGSRFNFDLIWKGPNAALSSDLDTPVYSLTDNVAIPGVTNYGTGGSVRLMEAMAETDGQYSFRVEASSGASVEETLQLNVMQTIADLRNVSPTGSPSDAQALAGVNSSPGLGGSMATGVFMGEEYTAIGQKNGDDVFLLRRAYSPTDPITSAADIATSSGTIGYELNADGVSVGQIAFADLDGDGENSLLISDPSYNNNRGAVFVIEPFVHSGAGVNYTEGGVDTVTTAVLSGPVDGARFGEQLSFGPDFFGAGSGGLAILAAGLGAGTGEVFVVRGSVIAGDAVIDENFFNDDINRGLLYDYSGDGNIELITMQRPTDGSARDRLWVGVPTESLGDGVLLRVRPPTTSPIRRTLDPVAPDANTAVLTGGSDDGLGRSLAIGTLVNGDLSVAIGSALTDTSAGKVTVLSGSALPSFGVRSSISMATTQYIAQGVAGAGAGYEVLVTDWDGDGQDDLAILAPNDNGFSDSVLNGGAIDPFTADHFANVAASETNTGFLYFIKGGSTYGGAVDLENLLIAPSLDGYAVLLGSGGSADSMSYRQSNSGPGKDILIATPDMDFGVVTSIQSKGIFKGW